MRATPKVRGVAVSALALALFLPASSSAGTITIVDGTNDIISFIDTTGRLGTANCPGSEASGCSFTIASPDPAFSSSTDHTAISLLEPPLLLFASDNLLRTNQATFGGTTWSFASDAESGLMILPNAFMLAENGQAQLVATITYLNAAGGLVGTDQIFIQSDLDPVATPEPASASLLLLGGGILVAAGRLRKRVHE